VGSVPILETEAQTLEPHWDRVSLDPFYEQISTKEKDRLEQTASKIIELN
jgi:Mlc titration factor MtfA (ptsG expression regulator)